MCCLHTTAALHDNETPLAYIGVTQEHEIPIAYIGVSPSLGSSSRMINLGVDAFILLFFAPTIVTFMLPDMILLSTCRISPPSHILLAGCLERIT